MNELPKECVLPVGVDWIYLLDGEVRVTIKDTLYAVPWGALTVEEKRFGAARCAMWWDAEEDKRQDVLLEKGGKKTLKSYVAAHNTMMAWKQLWRELEGVK